MCSFTHGLWFNTKYSFTKNVKFYRLIVVLQRNTVFFAYISRSYALLCKKFSSLEMCRCKNMTNMRCPHKYLNTMACDTRLFPFLIHQTEQSWIWHLFEQKPKLLEQSLPHQCTMCSLQSTMSLYFMAQVLDTVTYLVPQVLDTASSSNCLVRFYRLAI